MAVLEKEELRKVLEIILSKYSPVAELRLNKDEVINRVVERLTAAKCVIDAEELNTRKYPEKAREMVKALSTALVAEAGNKAIKDPNAQFDYTSLFQKVPRELNLQKELKDAFKKELKKWLNLINIKLEPDPKKRKPVDELDKIADKISDYLFKKAKEQEKEKLAHNKESVDHCAEFATAIHTLYGVNPNSQVAGKVAPVVQQVAMNYVGLLSMTPGAPGMSNMAKQNEANRGEYDPQGKESLTINNAISKGGMTPEMEEEIFSTVRHKTHSGMNPLSTTPKH